MNHIKIEVIPHDPNIKIYLDDTLLASPNGVYAIETDGERHIVSAVYGNNSTLSRDELTPHFKFFPQWKSSKVVVSFFGFSTRIHACSTTLEIKPHQNTHIKFTPYLDDYFNCMGVLGKKRAIAVDEDSKVTILSKKTKYGIEGLSPKQKRIFFAFQYLWLSLLHFAQILIFVLIGIDGYQHLDEMRGRMTGRDSLILFSIAAFYVLVKYLFFLVRNAKLSTGKAI